MIIIKRTTSASKDFIALVGLLDEDLASRDGDDHAFYAQFNMSDKIKQCIVAYKGSQPIGCGAFRPVDGHTVEIKRMYVHPSVRKRKIATKILQALESWAAEMEYKSCILETGIKQPEAISLYNKCGYQHILNYGPYIGVRNSLCFAKGV